MIDPRLPFPLVLLALGAVVLLVNKMHGENQLARVAIWLIAAMISMLVALWVVIGRNPLVVLR